MKNRAVRALLCGMFCVTLSGATILQVSAAPTAGVISAMTGQSASVEALAAKSAVSRSAEVELSTENDSETGALLTVGVTAEILGMATESTEAAAAETEPAVLPAETTEGTDALETTVAESPTTNSGVSQTIAELLLGTEAVPENETAEVPEETSEAAGDAAITGETPEDTVAAADTGESEEPAGEYDNIGIATVTDFVNVRSAADAESEAVGKLYANNALEVLGTSDDGGWYEIKSGDLTGFVSADYVEVGNQDLIKQASNRVATVHTETLFVRALPSQDSDVIGMVPDGEDLTVTDETYVNSWGWVGVSIEEGSGYVSTEYVDLSTEYTYGETKAAEEARLAKEEEERKAAEAAAAQKNNSSSGSTSSSSGSTGTAYAASGSGTGGSVANYALQFVGNPYVYGGSSLTNGTDCSGFVMSVYANYGVGLPHSSSALRSVGYGVDPANMQAGDIVCYSGHVGIYIGGGQIVHASTPSTGIKVSSAYYRDILAVRRIF